MEFPFTLAPDREFDVAGFGTNAVDFLIRVPEYPDFDSKVELSGYTKAAGGEVATAMVGLQRLGARTAYSGRFGDDQTGEYGLETLNEEGVSTRFCETIEGAMTQVAFIIIDERNGERTVIWKRDSKLAFSESEAPLELASSAKILHLTPHDTLAALCLAKKARSEGTIVSIDIDREFEGTDELLRHVDVMITTAELAEEMSGSTDRCEALRALASRYGCGVCGMTLGAAGSIIYSGGEFFETPGFEVPGGAKDTTGAGDSFRAGFIYGLLNGSSIEDAALAANAVAALKCREVGARTALPTKKELDDFLAESRHSK